MENGKAYVVLELKDGTFLFGPPRFIRYKNNTIEKAKALKGIADGRITNKAIDKAIKEYTRGNVKGYIEDAKYEKLLKQSFSDFKFHNNVVNHKANDIQAKANSKQFKESRIYAYSKSKHQRLF